MGRFELYRAREVHHCTILIVLISFLMSCEGTIGEENALPRPERVPERAQSRTNEPGPAGAEPPTSEPSGKPEEPTRPEEPKSPLEEPKSPLEEACAGAEEVAIAPLRRLTRTEYESSVEAVFGVTGGTGAGLAADERIDGIFASNQSSPVAPVQVRQYLDAAESIAAKVDLKTLVSCDQLAESACAERLIEQVGRRAYRRPLAAEDKDRYRALYAGMVELEGHEPALRAVVEALLQSPRFLYHVEEAAEADGRLEPYALASRLSFFLWSGPPDDALLDAASSGELDQLEGLARQARRMLDHTRARHTIESFHGQWLGLTRLEQASRDPKLFPEWNSDLVSAMRAEAAAFSDYVIRHEQGDLHTLLTASYSFPTGPGLAIRGTAAPQDPTEPTELGARAAGLLTQPAFLAAHAHSNQTSPILRGRALRERLFCQPLPDPPPNVAAVAPDLEEGLTTRERYAKHRTAGTACYGCHSLIDDLGFALEHYDAVGRFRDTEQGRPIDATGELRSTDVDGSLDGARALAERMSESRQVEDCYAKQWFRFALGRTEVTADRCALARVQDAHAKGGSIAELLIAIATSQAFVQHKGGQ